MRIDIREEKKTGRIYISINGKRVYHPGDVKCKDLQEWIQEEYAKAKIRIKLRKKAVKQGKPAAVRKDNITWTRPPEPKPAPKPADLQTVQPPNIQVITAPAQQPPPLLDTKKPAAKPPLPAKKPVAKAPKEHKKEKEGKKSDKEGKRSGKKSEADRPKTPDPLEGLRGKDLPPAHEAESLLYEMVDKARRSVKKKYTKPELKKMMEEFELYTVDSDPGEDEMIFDLVKAGYPEIIDEFDSYGLSWKAIIEYWDPRYADYMQGRGADGGALNSIQIKQYLARLGDRFLGVIPRDRINTLDFSGLRDRVGWVMNLDATGLPGSHWVGVVINRADQSVLWYDSFAREMPQDIKTAIAQVLKKIAPESRYKLKENGIVKQDEESSSCGWLVMGFLIDVLGRNKKFSSASGYDDSIAGEASVEKLKKTFGYL